MLDQKVVLVTGGNRGIGRAIVEALADCGASVAFTYFQGSSQAQTLVKELTESGHKVAAIQADAKDLGRTQQAVSEVMERFGRLDGLVNNAGIVRDKALMMMTADDWKEVLDTNLTGVFNACRAAIVTFMKQKAGSIVNITSVAGLVGAARQVNYAASKAGVIGLTRSLAKEVAAYSVTVNAIAPGYIETDMTTNLSAKQLDQARQQIPIARFGYPKEIADMVTFLLSNRARYITGQVMVIDGGLTL